MEQVIFVGIDFGTTFSGVCWAYSGQPDDIQNITNWNSEYSRCSDHGKTPTHLEYNTLSEVRKWGYGVPADQDVVQWFKLLLLNDADIPEKVRDSKQFKQVKKTQESLDESPVDIVACYLRLLWRHSLDTINRAKGQSLVDLCKFHITLTLPAIWPHYVQSKMIKAAELAGLLDGRQAGPTTLDFISEPEAAALATLSEMKDRPDILPGDTMIVCDVGGGTADLISYVIDSFSPFQIKECVAGRGGLCGGIFVDHNFEDLGASKVGKVVWKALDISEKRRFMNQDWENGIKTQFENQGRDWPVSLPPGCQPKASLGKRKRNYILELTSDELLGVFSPVIDEVSSLVHGQLEAIKSKNLKVPKFIILVGGFGSSRYLYKKLAANYRDSTILQGQGGKPWTAICRGATIHGVTSRQPNIQPVISVKSRIARYSYGMLSDISWDATRHDFRDKWWNEIAGCWDAKDQTHWFLTKGSVVESGWPIRHRFYRESTSRSQSTFTETLYYSAEDKSPTRNGEGVTELCELKWSSKIPLKWERLKSPVIFFPYYELSYEVRVQVIGPTLAIEVTHGRKTAARGNVQIRFE